MDRPLFLQRIETIMMEEELLPLFHSADQRALYEARKTQYLETALDEGTLCGTCVLPALAVTRKTMNQAQQVPGDHVEESEVTPGQIEYTWCFPSSDDMAHHIIELRDGTNPWSWLGTSHK
jgi:hypothetical protein